MPTHEPRIRPAVDEDDQRRTGRGVTVDRVYNVVLLLRGDLYKMTV